MNNSGTVIDHITYDPWGNPTDSNPSAGDRYKFTGQEYDSVTGQYNYRARCYDAAIGRFTSQDPEGFGGGDMILYRYCGNSPTGETDPTGMQQANVIGGGPPGGIHTTPPVTQTPPEPAPPQPAPPQPAAGWVKMGRELKCTRVFATSADQQGGLSAPPGFTPPIVGMVLNTFQAFRATKLTAFFTKTIYYWNPRTKQTKTVKKQTTVVITLTTVVDTELIYVLSVKFKGMGYFVFRTAGDEQRARNVASP